MNIHEYQAKAVLKEFGVPVSKGVAVFSPAEAEKAAKEPWNFQPPDTSKYKDKVRALEEDDLRKRLSAPAPHRDQALYVQDGLKTGRVMVKDEDVCLHCGLCAERCPTGAWDMKKYLIDMTHADDLCRTRHQSAA